MFTIRSRLFTGLIIITLAGFVYLTYWIATDIRIPALRGTEESLVEGAGILARAFGEKIVRGDTAAYNELHAVFDSIYVQENVALLYGEIKEHIDNRVYITDKKGTVVFDSYDGKDEGKDYSRWNDVYLTLKGRYGARTSKNDSFDPGTPYIYVGAPIMVKGEIAGVLSMGKPAGMIGDFIRRTRNRFMLIVVIAFLIVALAGIFLTLWVSRPIEKLTGYVRAVAKGETARKEPLGKGFLYGSRTEIDAMGDAIEEMRKSLEGRQYVENYIQSLVHSIKAPLSGIVASADVLDGLLDSDEAKQFNANINAEAGVIERKVAELMDLVRIECRENLDKAEDVRVDEMVNEIIGVYENPCDMKNISLRKGSIDESTVWGDRSLLVSAVRNLVDNAIDFTPEEGEIVISVQKEKRYVSVIVEDTGAGIPDFALSKIFDRYYSLPRPGVNTESSGLGLTFVKEVVSMHRGEVTVKNRKGKGTRAVLQLPLGSKNK